LFGGVTIDVKSNYTQKDKTEEINISQFSSDVDYMLFNPSNFSFSSTNCVSTMGNSKEEPFLTGHNNAKPSSEKLDNYTQKDKTEEINISQFSSDVDYMLFNPSNFSDDGFALCIIRV